MVVGLQSIEYRSKVIQPADTIRRAMAIFGACLLVLSSSLSSEAKPIRLRNVTLDPDPIAKGGTRGKSTAVESAAQLSGLLIVQFEENPPADWRNQLEDLQVHPLNAIPQDACLALARGAAFDKLKALPFVRWFGEFRPEYKVHSGLLARTKKAPAGVEIKFLLAPNVPAADRAALGQLLDKTVSESHTRFGSILQARTDLPKIAELARSPWVLWIEPAPHPKLLDEVADQIIAGTPTGPSPASGTLLTQLGFDGRGVTVSVADSGLNFGTPDQMHADLDGRVDGFFFYGNLLDAADEHGHGTHVAGIIAGNGATGETDDNGALYGLGVAPGAHLIAQRIFDEVGNFEPPKTMEVLTHDAVRSGAVIGSNSWGDDTQGRYDLSAAEFDALVRDADVDTPGDQPYILEFSAGNAGPGSQTIGSPAVAKNVIATGASQNNRFDFFIYADGQEIMADFSSRGPCEDGRIKPDLVAPGTWIASLQSAAATDENAWLPISPDYQYEGGTSQSGPHLSGSAAVFVQHYRSTHGQLTPSPALVKAALINAATPLSEAEGNAPVPNQDEGWGRVDLTPFVDAARQFDFLDQTVLLTNNQVFERRILVASSNQPLKITLTYTDVPGFPGAIPALVNDLDLEVVGPDGRIYRGNQFLEGDSVPNAAARDTVNNVEAVHFSEPAPGDYLVRIRATHVVEDARRDTAVVDQDFALVISGAFPALGVGVVVLDRPAYSAPAQVNLKLIDFDLGQQPAAQLVVKSDTEPAGETITVHASGTSGILTGQVQTVTGPAAPDGKLQVADGDTISVRYQDASPAALREATARADLSPPVISLVSATNLLGEVVISFATDEPAEAVVRFGTNAANLNLAEADPDFSTEHEVSIPNLVPGTTYFFEVSATDEAGNSSRADNNGAKFQFVPMNPPTVLLVDDFNDPILDNPLSGYTDPLDESGVSYNVWTVADRGSPTAANLKPFRIVIWRLSEFEDTPLTVPEQTALRDYLKGGGALFLSSMEILSRLDAGGYGEFRTNVLHVASYHEDVEVPAVTGIDSDPITSGMEFDLDFSAYPDLGIIPKDLSDTIQPTTNAAPIFLKSGEPEMAGLRFPRTGQSGPGRLVFLPFPFDAVPEGNDAPNNRRNLLLNIIRFLAPGLSGVSTIALDSRSYTVPSLVTVEVADADTNGKSQLGVRFVSTSDSAGVTVQLSETVEPGLFRGFVTLVAPGTVSKPGQLAAKNGDSITAEYLDESAQEVIHASATVDTIPPAISNVMVTPDYTEAEVDWDTSEPGDGLVQFGESAFLGRTAYSSEMASSHSLTLVGLLPDRQYFFRVVSRDEAGNAAEDDNAGRLHTFRTLKPLVPPWFDDLEHGTTNWLVENADLGSEQTPSGGQWEWGTPANGLASAAHSPTHVWGTNLKGEAIELAASDLIGPAIALTGGNQATLQFWHIYDFTPRSEFLDSEVGSINVSTNNGAAWIPLAQYSELSGGWDLEQIDLTPYLGQVIRLAWHYELFAFDAASRPGWAIDDVSVTVTNVIRGTLQITENLAQARFDISGPISTNGGGLNFVVTNAPPGNYLVTFADIPFYTTPPPQTNELKGFDVAIFRGTYNFPDANRNGISDDWEKFYFGDVSNNRTAATDSDGDGLTDLGEFRAGTNPNDAKSFLLLTPPTLLPNGTIRLDWPTVADHAYRVVGSQNLVDWLPFSNWLSAPSTNLSYTLPPLDRRAPHFFRIEVQP